MRVVRWIPLLILVVLLAFGLQAVMYNARQDEPHAIDSDDEREAARIAERRIAADAAPQPRSAFGDPIDWTVMYAEDERMQLFAYTYGGPEAVFFDFAAKGDRWRLRGTHVAAPLLGDED